MKENGVLKYDPQDMQAMFATMLARLDHQDEMYLRDRAHAQEFRATTIDTLRNIQNHTGTMDKRVGSLETSYKEDVVKWSNIRLNKDNWKIYGLLFIILVTSKIGADFITYAITFFKKILSINI